MTTPALRIAVLVPCFNEEAAVATVVADFRKALPTAEIFVYDNNSKDRTIAVAGEAGAEVRSERHQGKGHVVRRMFADIDAEVYVLVDGDATYDAPSAPRMVEKLLSEHLDMVVGFRVDHARGARSVIGRIAIDQHINVGIDVGEHAPDHMPLALAALAAHDGAGRARDLDGTVL